MMKRTFDILVAGLGLLLVAPLIVVCAVLVKIETPGPALFRQDRVGLNGRTFGLLKLRSMVVDAPSLGGHSTTADDPRITRVGRVLRRTSIDELPQLINVMRGEMSIVGPRPDVPAQRSEYEPEQWRRRVSVRPGITGLAQVSGRSSASPQDRLERDLEYVERNTVLGDIRICALTARQLFAGGSN